MKAFTQLTGTAAPLLEKGKPMSNVDTDMIIPKQFLKTTERTGLSKGLFHELKTLSDGSPRSDFVLNRPEYATASILIAGENFGCGSSREHAPWALSDFGFRAVISSDIADIFKSNAQKNGLLPVEVDEETHKKLLASPGAEVTIDLEACEVTFGDGETGRFPIEPFARRCLLDGVDPLGHLLNQMPDIEAYEKR